MQTETTYDAIVLGSGFGGSLLAAVLAEHGMSVLVIDRSRHPRFAIGESSTPLADQLLDDIADEFALPELKTISRYGIWKDRHPLMGCGLKRGFTYLSEAAAGDNGSTAPSRGLRRTLVAASSADAIADTHWLRSDVDQWFFRLAAQRGAECIEDCHYSLYEDVGWRVVVSDPAEQRTFRAAFLVDATGRGTALTQVLSIPSQTHTLRTNTRALFGHFSSVERCEDLLVAGGMDVSRFPFPCDDAAVHILLRDSWMWQLRFDDDSVSAGFAIREPRAQAGRGASAPETPPEQAFRRRVAESDLLSRQFRDAQVVRPADGIQATGRLQRLTTQAAGSNWAMLPHTAGFIDPLHSTGIAHTLTGVRRLGRILTCELSPADRTRRLDEYGCSTIDELRCIDALVEGCYAALPDFDLFCDWSMLYFAAVTSMEQASSAAPPDGASFLRAHDNAFRSTVRAARSQLEAALQAESAAARSAFRPWLRAAIAPWNQTGLLDDAANGLYASTAAR